jgi:hypothetical protein
MHPEQHQNLLVFCLLPVEPFPLSTAALEPTPKMAFKIRLRRPGADQISLAGKGLTFGNGKWLCRG